MSVATPLSSSDNPSADRVVRMAQLAIILVTTALHVIFLSQAKPLQSANDRSRWCTVWSLIERGTFQIDEIRQRPGWDTIDLVHVDDHFYSTKPPLLTSVVAGLTWCIQRVTGWNLIKQLHQVTFVVLLAVNILPFLISLFAWKFTLVQISDRPWVRLFGVTIAAFGTLLTPFLMVLNNHTVAAASATIALYALLKILRDESQAPAKWPYALCGFAVAWTAANELPATAFAGLIGLLALRRSMLNTLVAFIPAAAIPLIALVATNVVATGSWKPVYADYGTDKYKFIIDGVPSYWMNPQGVDRNLDSPAIYFLHCMIGHHGLYSLTPVMLLSLAGWLSCFWLRDRAIRTLVGLSAITSTVVIAFYLTRTQNYNYGGVSCGLRWALWLTPLMLIAAVPVLNWLARSRRARGFAWVLLLGSMYSAWEPIDNPWRQPWLFQWMDAKGWIDYSDDAPELPKDQWTWFASLPETTDDQPAWIEFSVAQPGLASRLIRITARPATTSKPGERIDLEVRESSTDETVTPRTRSIQVDVAKFNDGAKPAQFMRWPDAKVTPAQQQADLAFVRGLPQLVPYRARTNRYLKTTLRPEALKCIQAAASTGWSAKEGDPHLVYRCDVWVTNDIPFGVAQVDYHITQADNGHVLFHERWTVRDCSPKVRPFDPRTVMPSANAKD